jgi:hypothetical protein
LDEPIASIFSVRLKMEASGPNVKIIIFFVVYFTVCSFFPFLEPNIIFTTVSLRPSVYELALRKS